MLASTSGAYDWIWIVVGVLAIIGSVIGALRWVDHRIGKPLRTVMGEAETADDPGKPSLYQLTKTAKETGEKALAISTEHSVKLSTIALQQDQMKLDILQARDVAVSTAATLAAKVESTAGALAAKVDVSDVQRHQDLAAIGTKLDEHIAHDMQRFGKHDEDISSLQQHSHG